jgi:hypothetical protein
VLARSHRTFRRCATVALLGAAAILPATASAADCPDQPTTQAFAKIGDLADYALAPGGDFEKGTAGWTLNNAHLVAGNETVGILPGYRSVAMGNNWFVTGPSTLTSPWFCVNNDHPYFRYLLKPNGPVGLLATYVRYKGTNGQLLQQQVQSRVSTNLFPGKWQASQLNPLSLTLPIKDGETAKVQLVFITPGSVLGAGYFIDNVLVDPYRRG